MGGGSGDLCVVTLGLIWPFSTVVCDVAMVVFFGETVRISDFEEWGSIEECVCRELITEGVVEADMLFGPFLEMTELRTVDAVGCVDIVVW